LRATTQEIMRVLIVEDEIDARKVLVYLLKFLFPDMQIVGETGSVKKAKALINKLQPDVVFLDVRLEDGSGLDILNNNSTFELNVIFTTAYSDFALNAIKFNAIDYLLKPINPSELKIAVEKVKKIKEKEIELKKLKTVVEKNLDFRITIKTAEQTFVVPVSDIVRLEADGSYTTLITTENKIIASKNIKYFQDILPEEFFLRTHQSHLVNKKCIIKINKNGSLLLANNDEVPISYRKKSIVRKLLNNKI